MARIKLSNGIAVYHCISRIVGGQFLLDDLGKEKLRHLLWQQAAFSGVEIVTYCLMSNHFHVLVRVDAEASVGDVQLQERVERFYGKKALLSQLIRESLKRSGSISEELREPLLERMNDVSMFIKELKQRFSRWYNKQNGRFGTLWAERFRSLLVENQPSALETVAAYIDLNPVRAGLVEDSKDYRFCGYAEAMAGNVTARTGIKSFVEGKDWRQVAAAYRMGLFVTGGMSRRSGKQSLTRDQIQAVLNKGGELSRAEALRLRIRHMSDGVVLGSRTFVNEMFLKFRDRFGARRKTGARKLRRLPFEGVWTLRDLRVESVE